MSALQPVELALQSPSRLSELEACVQALTCAASRGLSKSKASRQPRSAADAKRATLPDLNRLPEAPSMAGTSATTPATSDAGAEHSTHACALASSAQRGQSEETVPSPDSECSPSASSTATLTSVSDVYTSASLPSMGRALSPAGSPCCSLSGNTAVRTMQPASCLAGKACGSATRTATVVGKAACAGMDSVRSSMAYSAYSKIPQPPGLLQPIPALPSLLTSPMQPLTPQPQMPRRATMGKGMSSGGGGQSSGPAALQASRQTLQAVAYPAPSHPQAHTHSEAHTGATTLRAPHRVSASTSHMAMPKQDTQMYRNSVWLQQEGSQQQAHAHRHAMYATPMARNPREGIGSVRQLTPCVATQSKAGLYLAPVSSSPKAAAPGMGSKQASSKNASAAHSSSVRSSTVPGSATPYLASAAPACMSMYSTTASRARDAHIQGQLKAQAQAEAKARAKMPAPYGIAHAKGWPLGAVACRPVSKQGGWPAGNAASMHSSMWAIQSATSTTRAPAGASTIGQRPGAAVKSGHTMTITPGKVRTAAAGKLPGTAAAAADAADAAAVTVKAKVALAGGAGGISPKSVAQGRPHGASDASRPPHAASVSSSAKPAQAKATAADGSALHMRMLWAPLPSMPVLYCSPERGSRNPNSPDDLRPAQASIPAANRYPPACGNSSTHRSSASSIRGSIDITSPAPQTSLSPGKSMRLQRMFDLGSLLEDDRNGSLLKDNDGDFLTLPPPPLDVAKGGPLTALAHGSAFANAAAMAGTDTLGAMSEACVFGSAFTNGTGVGAMAHAGSGAASRNTSPATTASGLMAGASAANAMSLKDLPLMLCPAGPSSHTTALASVLSSRPNSRQVSPLRANFASFCVRAAVASYEIKLGSLLSGVPSCSGATMPASGLSYVRLLAMDGDANQQSQHHEGQQEWLMPTTPSLPAKAVESCNSQSTAVPVLNKQASFDKDGLALDPIAYTTALFAFELATSDAKSKPALAAALASISCSSFPSMDSTICELASQPSAASDTDKDGPAPVLVKVPTAVAAKPTQKAGGVVTCLTPKTPSQQRGLSQRLLLRTHVESLGPGGLGGSSPSVAS